MEKEPSDDGYALRRIRNNRLTRPKAEAIISFYLLLSLKQEIIAMITIQKANNASNVTIPNKVRISNSYRTTPFVCI